MRATQNVVMLSVANLNVIMLSVVMLNEATHNVVMLSVIMPNVMAPPNLSKFRIGFVAQYWTGAILTKLFFCFVTDRK